MRLLYISSWHGTLEYDELLLFGEMGIDWFSTGYYLHPHEPLQHKHRFEKPPIPYEVDPLEVEIFSEANPNYQPYSCIRVPEALVRRFDVVMVSHCNPVPEILSINHPTFTAAGKPVIWRTYAQQQTPVEERVRALAEAGPRLWLVRGSPNESLIPGFAGMDAVVRPYVDETKFFGWRGEDASILSFHNQYGRRTYISHTPLYERIIRGFPSKLYGYDSETAPNYCGFLSEEDQLDAYRSHRAYFALGSKPGTITYNLLEAMMTGAPVVTWGALTGTDHYFPGYEVHQLFQNGSEILLVDNEIEGREAVSQLLTNPDFGKTIGDAGQAAARKLYGKATCRRDWANLFERILE